MRNPTKLSIKSTFLVAETYKYLYSRHVQANVPPPEKNRERSASKLSRRGSKASINGRN